MTQRSLIQRAEVSLLIFATGLLVSVVVWIGYAGLSSGPIEAQGSGGPFAYVTNLNSDSVSVIDTTTNTVVETISVGIGPERVAIAPDGSRAYVTNRNSDSVSVIDTSTNTVIDSVTVGDLPIGVAVTPDGTRVYVVNFFANSVSVIDATANTVVDTVAVGSVPRQVAITPDGSRAYVTNDFGDSVSVIDTATNTVVDTVPVEDGPFGVAITPDGTRAYVANRRSNSVSVIDTATNTVVDAVQVDGFLFEVAINSKGTRAYVATFGPNSVSVIDTSTNTVVDTVILSSDAQGVAVTPDGTRVYATLTSASSVSVIDTTTNTVVDMVAVGLTPLGVAITPLANTTPTSDAAGPYSGDEGSAIPLSGASASDPDGDPLTFTWTVDSALCSFSDASALNPDVTCGDNGSFIATLTVSDGTESLSSNATIVVNNVAPAVGAITAPLDPVQVGTSINASATFTDPGVADTHDAVWDWGDGETTPQVGVTSPVAASHTYTEAGVHTVTLTVTDDDGGVGVSVFEFVVVYDPDGGFVTGGGWIDSPPGAYTPDDDTDPDVTGKANFGFVSKYKKGATVPSGQTEFQFKAGDLNFHSADYQWLVVAGARAQFKGTGTVNGAGKYGFMLTAIDAKLTPSTDADLFRVKIWDKHAGDAVLYDNQAGAGDDADPTTAIGGGSIVIHAK